MQRRPAINRAQRAQLEETGDLELETMNRPLKKKKYRKGMPLRENAPPSETDLRRRGIEALSTTLK